MEHKTTTPNKTLKTDSVRKADAAPGIAPVRLLKGTEILGYPGYFWAVPVSDDSSVTVSRSGSVLFYGDLPGQTCIVGEPKLSLGRKQNILFGAQYHDTKDGASQLPVSINGPMNECGADHNIFQYLAWTASSGDEDILQENTPPISFNALLVLWQDQQMKQQGQESNEFLSALEVGDPPTVEVEGPDVDVEMINPTKGQEYSIDSQGQVTLFLDGVILFNEQKARDEHHRWDIDGVENFIGPTGTIKRTLAPGSHTVALRYHLTGQKETVTITVVQALTP